MKRLYYPLIALSVAGCASIAGCASGRLNTPSGKPEVSLRNDKVKNLTSIVKDLSVEIAAYNLSKGRELDQVKADELVLYDAVKSSNGEEQVTGKTVYEFSLVGDSLTVYSHRFVTTDLDDETASEADDQATYDLEQQELQEIARNVITRSTSEHELASPAAGN